MTREGEDEMAQIKGTANMATYPGHPLPGMAKHRGIDHYGHVSCNGYRALKVSERNIAQLESIGYRYIGRGTSYAYVAKR